MGRVKVASASANPASQGLELNSEVSNGCKLMEVLKLLFTQLIKRPSASIFGVRI